MNPETGNAPKGFLSNWPVKLRMTGIDIQVIRSFTGQSDALKQTITPSQTANSSHERLRKYSTNF